MLKALRGSVLRAAGCDMVLRVVRSVESYLDAGVSSDGRTLRWIANDTPEEKEDEEDEKDLLLFAQGQPIDCATTP